MEEKVLFMKKNAYSGNTFSFYYRQKALILLSFLLVYLDNILGEYFKRQ